MSNLEAVRLVLRRLLSQPRGNVMNISMTGPVVRGAEPRDIEAAGAICYEAFKAIADLHGFPPDFPNQQDAIGLIDYLMTRTDIYAVVAELDHQVVGSNFLWENGLVAGIGPITVDTGFQNGRIGRRLMEAVLLRAREKGVRSVRLVQAGYHLRSLSLYIQLGFEAKEPLCVMQGNALALRVEGRCVRKAREADIEAADRLCRQVHGHTRSTELQAAISLGSAEIVECDGRLTGYTTGVGFFGHSVGETTEDLHALIGAAESFSGPGFFVPARNGPLLRWCLGHGLRIVQPMTLMAMGDYSEPQAPFLPSVLY